MSVGLGLRRTLVPSQVWSIGSVRTAYAFLLSFGCDKRRRVCRAFGVDRQQQAGCSSGRRLVNERKHSRVEHMYLPRKG